MGELLRTLKERGTGIDDVPLAPRALAGLIRLVDKGAISSSRRQGRVRARCTTQDDRPTTSWRPTGWRRSMTKAALAGARAGRHRPARRRRRAVPRGEDRDIRVSRWPGHEGKRREGEPEAGQPAPEARAGQLSSGTGEPAELARSSLELDADLERILTLSNDSVARVHRQRDRDASPLEVIQPRFVRAARSDDCRWQGRVRLPDGPERRGQVHPPSSALAAGTSERRRDHRQRTAICPSCRAARFRNIAAASGSSSRTSS